MVNVVNFVNNDDRLQLKITRKGGIYLSQQLTMTNSGSKVLYRANDLQGIGD